MLLGRGRRRRLWLPPWYFGQVACALGVAAYVWQRWGGPAALAVAVLLPLGAGLFVARWIAVRDGRVRVWGLLSRPTLPADQARLEVSRSTGHRGSIWRLELVDGTTGERVHLWSLLSAVGALRVMRDLGDALDIPVRPPDIDPERARRGALGIGAIVAVPVAILMAAGLYLLLRPASLTVTLQPGGEVELDGTRLTLDERLELPRPPGVKTKVDISPGPHRIAFRRHGHGRWVRVRFTAEDHQTYQLWVGFNSGRALLMGPHKYRKELPVVPVKHRNR